MRDPDRLVVRFLRSPSLLLFIPFLFASLALAAPAGPATAAAPATSGEFSSNVTVRAGEVDAVVTDKDGNPVHGLTLSDFKVLLDGTPIKVDLFEEVRAGSANGVHSGSTSSASPSAITVAPVVHAPRDFLIFVDDAFLVPALNNALLRGLAADLGSLAPGDRVAVVAYANNRLDTLTGWTSSAAKIHAALAQAEKRSGQGVNWLAFVSQASSSETAPGFDHDRTQLERYVDAIKHSVLAAAGAMRRFDPGKGKKILLLVTGGWPENPYDYLWRLPSGSPRSTIALRGARRGSRVHAITPEDLGANSGLGSVESARESSISARRIDLPLPVFFPPDDVYGGESLFRPMTDTANLLGYAIYGANRAPGNPTWPSPDNSTVPETSRMFNMEGSLVFAAHATGGRALFHGNAETSFARAARDFSTYYRLGFKLPAEDHAVRHAVKVEVLRSGLVVRSRRELVQAPEAVSPKLALVDALAVGTPLKDRGVKLETGKAKAVSRSERRVALTIKVPWSLLEVTPDTDGKGYISSFKIALRAQNENGGKSTLADLPVHMTLPGRPPEGSFMSYRTTLQLKTGQERIAAAAYDPKVGEVGVAVASLDLK